MARNRFALVVVLVFLSRLPFLTPGYGTDPDAWRAAWASQTIARGGGYEASRLPGNPLHELAGALLVRGGPLALDGASAAFSALAAGFFLLVLRRLGTRDDLAGALALASAPALAIASVQAMDYSWSLAFSLAALAFALGGRAAPAGALAGLAIGCRLTSGAWLPPLILALAHATPPPLRIRRALILSGVALAVGAAAYLPVVATYGPGFFSFYQTGYPGATLLVKNATVDVWGLPGSLAIGAAIAFRIARRRRGDGGSAGSGDGDRLLRVAWWSGLALFLVAYLRLPVKAFYLIPAIPFTLLLLARALSRRAFVAVCVAIIASPWILKVVQEDRIEGPPPARGVVPLRVLGRPYILDLARGPVITDRIRRVRRTDYVDAALERARGLDRPGVVVCWDWLPEIRVRLGGKQAGPVRFTYLLTEAELRDLEGRGIAVYSLAGAEWENERVHGFRLGERGVRPLLE